MAEAITLTSPEVTPAVTTANYTLVYLGLYWEQQQIVIHLRGEHGELKQLGYGGLDTATRAKALALMVALNKANLTVKSLQRRVLEQLIADFPLLFTAVAGAPD